MAADLLDPSLTGLALALARQASAAPGLLAVVVEDEGRAYRLEAELRFLLSDGMPVIHLQGTETLPFDPYSPHQEILSERLATLYRLPDAQRGVLLVTVDALLQRFPPRAWLMGRSFLLKRGQTLNPNTLRDRLIAAGYASVNQVQTQGEFAQRGSLMDVYPMGSGAAYRLDWFDEELESIRIFDPETQLSQDKVAEIRLLPAREFPNDKEGIEVFRRNYRSAFPGDLSRSRIYAEVSKGLMPGGIEAYMPLFFADQITGMLADYLPNNAEWRLPPQIAQLLAEGFQQIEARRERYLGNLERPLLPAAQVFLPVSEASLQLELFAQAPLPAPLGVGVKGTADAVKALLADNAKRLLFVAESAGRREAVVQWLKPLGIIPRQYPHAPAFWADNGRVGVVLGPLQTSLLLPQEHIALIAEGELFGLTAPVTRELKRKQRVRDPESILRDLSQLTLGSPVVHVQHGVGRYRGLQTLDAGGIPNEYLVLEYAGGDKLYVPVGSLALVHRYTGAEQETAPLHSMGTDRWEKAQKKAREKAHDVAAELLKIQARRAAKPGLQLDLAEDDYQAFANAFPFATTPDQQSAIDAVLADLQRDKPMDRIVCGDVGFGKTEVALRACFATARAGRQVCILAPTTLLATQHEKNFKDRLAEWPITVGGLSRMKTAREQTQLLEQLAEGKVDVVIGTHRLLQEDVRFKDLGLVIVDEEHRFGVRHKERLKNLRAEVDLLTLTATPIPRTLNMGLAGLRDMSIIATPPPSRQAIKTVVSEWDNGTVYEACLRELKRGGQVYFLHNEVKDIEVFSKKVQDLVPEARVRFAHGQMRERELEQVMLDFYHNRFNVLVCTTIIESGIDVPNANTILIDRADTLGLAQLHQLRGRVGRSHHRAYAYLLVPSKRSLSEDAQKRLEAIETLGDLGSGFALSTHDLEIRGAGELLGDEQTGQITEVGFTLYSELLARAVKAIQNGKLDDSPFGISAVEVDTGVACLIPADYVPDVATRLTLYKRLSEASTAEALRELQIEFIDRFGMLPDATKNLFEQASLRMACERLGLIRLRAHSKGATLEFGPAPKVDAVKMIGMIQKQPKVFKLEGQKKLHIASDLPDPAARLEKLHTLIAQLAG